MWDPSRALFPGLFWAWEPEQMCTKFCDMYRMLHSEAETPHGVFAKRWVDQRRLTVLVCAY